MEASLNNDRIKMKNSFFKVRLLVGGIGEIFLITLFLFFMGEGNIGPAILLSIFIIICPILFIYIDIIHRPTYVIFVNDGLILEFRYTNPKSISFDSITFVNRDDPRYYDAGFGVKGQLGYNVSPQICGMIRKKYFEKKEYFL